MNGRATLLAAAVRAVDVAADASARILPARPRLPAGHAAEGFAIVIPERGTPDLLDPCLASVRAAVAQLPVPVDIVVAQNGGDPAAYDALAARHPDVRWRHHRRALGFGGAVAMGLADVAQDWVYLLNSDMTLAPDTLAQLLPWRDDRTFAIASQIFFVDTARRREETGWTDFAVTAGVTEHFDREPEGTAVRGHLYAGGGASLFRAARLRAYMATTASYAPFYFEDADWGVQAARDGLQVKFCPASRVRHVHRGTIGRYFPAGEIARIVRRNALQFELRHGFGGRADVLRDAPPSTQRELTAIGTLATMLRERWKTRRARASGYAPELACASTYAAAFAPALPNVMIVVPADGATGDGTLDLDALARRCAALAGHANAILVTDHPALCMAIPLEGLPGFAAIHRVAPGERTRLAARRFARHVEWWRRCYDATVRVAPLRAGGNDPTTAPPLQGAHRCEPGGVR